MRIKHIRHIPIALFLMLSLQINAQDTVHAFTGATIIPVTGTPVEQGVLLVQRGRILAIGDAATVTVPGDAVIHDVSGKVILPGLVDTHSHLGSGDGGDRSNALHPDVRIMDAIDPVSDNFKRAIAGGLTTINVMPGSGHLMSGQTVYLKMRSGARVIEDILICDDSDPPVCGGLKMANGTNSIRSEGPFPGTRAKSAAMIRELYVKALDYRDKIQRADGDLEKIPSRDLRMEALLEVLDGRRIVHFHTHRHDDVMTAIRLGQEFGFLPVLHHVSEGWKVADEIAAAGVPSSIIVIDAPGGKLEAVHLLTNTGSIMELAGCEIAFHTDDYVTDSRLFLRSAGLAVRDGMSEQKALEALTIAGARMLGLEDRIGSLEPGKDADFIILSGDPLSVYTQVEQTWVEGMKVFDLADPDDRKYAVGGFQVYRDRLSHVHDHD